MGQSSSSELVDGSRPFNQHNGQSINPPPTRSLPPHGGLIDSPQMFSDGDLNPYGYGANSSESGNGQQAYMADGQAPSPIRFRYENLGNRKRSYDQRDSSSDEDESEGRRQEDDFTPKYKRSQPKVAEAYR